MKRSLSLGAALCAAVLFTPLSHAQDLYVGSNSSGVTTDFTSGTNSFDNTFIGYDPDDSNNTLNVYNAGTLLNVADIFVGEEGSGNSLVVSNGGMVAGSSGYIGYRPISSSNNILVTGGGSSLVMTDNLNVGDEGHDNSLVISNGGTVQNKYGGIGRYSASSNNSAVVTGSGSVWSNNELNVGYLGAGNSLIISDGGAVQSSDGFIGRRGSAANNNSVVVAGTNSAWTNSDELSVGYAGSGNSLVISNGGRVANYYGYVGYNTNSSNNSVLVTGTGSQWTNSNELHVGSSGNSNSLVVNNGGVVRSGGDFRVGSIGDGNSVVISDGGTVQSSFATIGEDAANNSVLVTGTNSAWTNSGSLFVGFFGDGNSLVVNNGGVVQSGGRLGVSYGGNSNSLIISNGGTVTADSLVLGYSAGASDNSARITGAGSSLFLAGELRVSYDANTGNSVTIADGGFGIEL